MSARPVRLGIVCALVALLAAPARAAAPRDATGFALAVPPYAFAFPRDHAAHPAFRTEWWYYTGHLGSGARRFGYELTFFRVGLDAAPRPEHSAWAARDLYFVHVALTDPATRRFTYQDAASRAALGMAGADSARYHVWLEGSSATLAPDGRTHQLRAHLAGIDFTLELAPLKPPAIHGADGVSVKGPGVGQASHYYSLTRMRTRGRLALGADTLAVTGTSWMDHEFGSARMGERLAGWDWFSVQLDDGRELMLYRLRQKGGGIAPYSSGSLIERDGRVRRVSLAETRVLATGEWRSPHTHARYPSGWRVSLPGEGLALELAPQLRDQELVASAMGGVVYWEGAVDVRGTSHGRPLGGVGYVELTGYTGRPPY